MGLFIGEHMYTLGVTGMKVKCDTYYATRQAATSKMYEIIGKKHLHIKEIYDDKHFKTYVCEEGVTFYINRM